MPMKNPPHPGLSIRHDCLKPLGLKATEAAEKLGVSRKQLSERGQWSCGNLAGDGDPFGQGVRRGSEYVVPLAGGIRLGAGDEARRPDQG